MIELSATLRSPNPVLARPVLADTRVPDREEINAELRQRGLPPVLELVAQEMEREDSGSREAEDPAIRAAGSRGTATNKDTNNRSSAR
jgi:hypothetical protein